MEKKSLEKLITLTIAGLATLLVLSTGAYMAYADKILPNVFVGDMPIGGLSRAEAEAKIKVIADQIQQDGITLIIGDDQFVLKLANISYQVKVDETIAAAVGIGRTGPQLGRAADWLEASLGHHQIYPRVSFSPESLENEIAILATQIDQPRKDLRLQIEGQAVVILQDTQSGKIIDQGGLNGILTAALLNLDRAPKVIPQIDDLPSATMASALIAQKDARSMLARPLYLVHEKQKFVISPEQIGSWVTSEYRGQELKASLDREAINIYMTRIAGDVNVPAGPPRVGLPPLLGRALEEDKTVDLIVEALFKRTEGSTIEAAITLPVKDVQAANGQDLNGVADLIGKATTPFTGSPVNRIHNIKNGVRFLSGLVIQPGEVFSTLGALGAVDNTNGYLPEMVIKGTRTAPEFGGGLCQVSTTLFRAVLNAGLPVVSRRNHSYRVPYYEYDGQGKFIGPGLDATIYVPDLDFKFKNDTATPILIYGYVKGDKATFELYGTADGRVAKIEGPKMVNEIPAGDPVYIKSKNLAAGVTRQVESPHPGGSAVANYTVTFPSGRVVQQEFKSFYRRWPAQFLIGTKDVTLGN